MRAFGVVVAAKPVELLLQLGDVLHLRLLGQPLLLGLVEQLHLAAGLRVVRRGVRVGDPQCIELHLDGTASSSTGRSREHRGVVRQHRGREPMRRKRPVEALNDVPAFRDRSRV
jgi:hypothetical protein